VTNQTAPRRPYPAIQCPTPQNRHVPQTARNPFPQRLWRAWLNRRLLDRWLANSRYYQLNLVKGDHANPEYRLAEDLRLATEAPIDFAVGVISAFLSAVTFILVLWTIGGTLSFSVAGAIITIPGFLVIAAVIYAVLASGTGSC